MTEESFLPFLINILKETEYTEIESIEKHKEWAALEDKEMLKPFIEWLMNSVTHENCLTSDEIVLYNFLKHNNKLIPEDELDQKLQEYFKVELYDISEAHTQFSIDEAEKELQALQSLESFLLQQEKKVKKNKKVIEELDPFLKSEIKELETLNGLCNEALNNYAHAWDNLQNHTSQEHFNESCLSKHLNMIFFNNQINQNLNIHFKNYFQEIKPTDGKLTIYPIDYWAIHKKLSEVRSEIIETTATICGKSLILNYFAELEHLIHIDPYQISISDIEKFLNEIPNTNEKLNEELSVILEDEVSCIVNVQINDLKKCSSFLEDRFDKLNKIENILNKKIIFNDTFKFIIKRDKVVRDFQFETLNEYSKNIESIVIQQERRMECLRNYRNINKVFAIDPYYKRMMKCLGVQNSDYKSFATKVTSFNNQFHSSFNDLEDTLQSFQAKFSERLNKVKKIDNKLIDGPTREMFGHVFNKHIANLEDNSKRQKKIVETFSKVETMLKEVKTKSGRKDRIWLKCLENPKEFLSRLYEIEKETDFLKERVKIEVMNEQ